MKWRKHTPKHGDERTVRRFLLLPRCINGEWRWLELATIRQEWQVYPYYRRRNSWYDLHWIDDKERA